MVKLKNSASVSLYRVKETILEIKAEIAANASLRAYYPRFLEFLTQHERRITDCFNKGVIPPIQALHEVRKKDSFKILDVGIGIGVTSIILKKLFNGEMRGMDKEEYYFPLLQNYGIEVDLVDIAGGTFPYSSESFDMVIFSEVLEHLRCPPKTALGEIKRVLKPNGYLVLTTPNMASLAHIGQLAIGNNILPEFKNLRNMQHITDSWSHIREYTLKEVVGILQEEGFGHIYMSICWDKQIQLRRRWGSLVGKLAYIIVLQIFRRLRSCIMIRAANLNCHKGEITYLNHVRRNNLDEKGHSLLRTLGEGKSKPNSSGYRSASKALGAKYSGFASN